MTKFGIVFLAVLLGAALPAARSVSHPRPRQLAPSVAANERLTALNGGLLFIGLLLIGATILFIQRVLPEHYLVGFVLIPPLALKLASTGYRFARYYTGNPGYRLAGAPPAMLRLTAPILVAATLAAFGTGVELWLVGLRLGTGWMAAHIVSAVVMLLATGVHLLGHLARSTSAASEALARIRVAGSPSPRALVGAALAVGLLLAAASLLYATPFPSAAAGG